MTETLSAKPSFNELLQKKWDEGKFVCVGLDADLSKLPPHLLDKESRYATFNAQYEFNRAIVEATKDIVCAYKPNIAFYEMNTSGEGALSDTVRMIHNVAQGVPVIGDVKRADIGNTNKGYSEAAYRRYGFDAITTNPYFGGDTFGPFTSYEGKGLIVLCKTSNPGSKEIQDMPIELVDAKNEGLVTEEEFDELDDILEGYNPRVYQMVAFLAARRWNKSGNLALVVGATHPEAFVQVRRLAGDIPFLIPGIGTQGGDLEKTLLYAPDSKGQGMIINSASGIIFASRGEDFAEAARKKTIELHEQITKLRAA